jgi:Glycosyl transferase family 2
MQTRTETPPLTARLQAGKRVLHTCGRETPLDNRATPCGGTNAKDESGSKPLSRDHMHADIDVPVMTRGRPVELATMLAGLASQEHATFRVVVSDQFDGAAAFDTPAASAMARVLDLHGRPTQFVRHLPRRGVAEHRAFLLEQASAPYALVLDDDVWLERNAITRLHEAITTLGCSFVGAAVPKVVVPRRRPPGRARAVQAVDRRRRWPAMAAPGCCPAVRCTWSPRRRCATGESRPPLYPMNPAETKGVCA